MPISDGSISTRQLCVGAVTERVIGTDAVTDDAIADGAVSITAFASGINPVQVVSSLPGGAAIGDMAFLTTNQKLYRYDGTAWTVSTDGADIIADSITAGQIAVGAINTDELAANAVTATKISVASLSAITATMGTLNIDSTLTMGASGIITMGAGGTIRTAASGQRVEMAEAFNDRISFYSGLAGETTPAQIQTATVSTTGILKVTGPVMSSGESQIEMYAADQISIDTNNSTGILMDDSSSNMELRIGATSGQILMWDVAAASGVDGSAAEPILAFVDDTDTGIYRIAANTLGIATGGNLVTEFLTIGIVGNGTAGTPLIRTRATGTVGAPTYSWDGDGDTGLYRVSSDYVAMAAGGNILMQWGWTGSGKELYMYGLGNVAANVVQYNGTTGLISYQSSTRRMKKNIHTFDTVGLSDRLQPRWYKMKDEPEYGPFDRVGLIAEEVADVLPEAGIYMTADDTEPTNFEDRAVIAVLLADLQDARRRIATLEGI